MPRKGLCSSNDTPIVIDSIEIINENVYDLSKPEYNNFLFRMADRLHVVTHKAVIRRELLLRVGDKYDTSLVNESARNLRQLSFILKVNIYLKTGRLGEHILVVNTSDKWSARLSLDYGRSGGQGNFRFSLKESNLLGYGIYISHDYVVPDDDRAFYQGHLRNNRFWGGRLSLDLFYSDNPANGIVDVILRRPFYSLGQKWAGGIEYEHTISRSDYYFAEVLSARDRKYRTFLSGDITYRTGGNNFKYSFGGLYEFVDLKKRDRVFLVDSLFYDNQYLGQDSIAELLPPLVEDSIYHYFQFSFRVQQIHFITMNRINRFEKLEDFNLGFACEIGTGVALPNGFRKRLYSTFNVWPQYTYQYGHMLVSGGAQYKAWAGNSDVLRENIGAAIKAYLHYHDNFTCAIGLRYLTDRLRDNAMILYMDENTGLRGYPAYFYNGEQRIILNIENRFFSNIELLSVGLGGVVFADIGNIWSRNSGFDLKNSKTSVGAGLRLGVSRSINAEVIRIDMAYAIDIKTWQISIGTGQYF